jgi:hypothetical protein
MVDDELEEGELEPVRHDPLCGMRRLAQAVILQAALDFTESKDPHAWKDAERFLFAEDPKNQELFRWTLEVSAIDPRWLRRCLFRAREQTSRPPGLRSCKNCGPLPISEFRNGDCKKCRREAETRRRREAGMHVRRPSLTRPRGKGGPGSWYGLPAGIATTGAEGI